MPLDNAYLIVRVAAASRFPLGRGGESHAETIKRQSFDFGPP
jgi:hypothetical protein